MVGVGARALSFGRAHRWLVAGVGGAVVAAGAVAFALFIWAIVRTHNEGATELGPSALAVGEQHACVLLQGGVKCWGENLWGSLGNGKNGMAESSSTPVDVVGLGGRVAAITAAAPTPVHSYRPAPSSAGATTFTASSAMEPAAMPYRTSRSSGPSMS